MKRHTSLRLTDIKLSNSFLAQITSNFKLNTSTNEMLYLKDQLLNSAAAVTPDQHETFKGRKEDTQDNTHAAVHLPAQWRRCRRGLLWRKLQRSPVKQTGETADPLQEPWVCALAWENLPALFFFHFILFRKIYNASLISIKFPFGTMPIHSHSSVGT